MSTLQCFIIKSFDYILSWETYNIQVCFRCKKEGGHMQNLCLNCKKAYYCSEECKEKNAPVHEKVCEVLLEKALVISKVIEEIAINHKTYSQHIKFIQEIQGVIF